MKDTKLADELDLDNITLEGLYDHYLDKVELKEGEMGTVQRIETKRAFVAGLSSAMVVMSELNESAPENHCVETVNSLYKELNNYWKTQV